MEAPHTAISTEAQRFLFGQFARRDCWKFRGTLCGCSSLRGLFWPLSIYFVSGIHCIIRIARWYQRPCCKSDLPSCGNSPLLQPGARLVLDFRILLLYLVLYIFAVSDLLIQLVGASRTQLESELPLLYKSIGSDQMSKKQPRLFRRSNLVHAYVDSWVLLL